MAKGATDARPERATAKMTSRRPNVATTSPSHSASGAPGGGGQLDRGQLEHEVGDDGAGHRARQLAAT